MQQKWDAEATIVMMTLLQEHTSGVSVLSLKANLAARKLPFQVGHHVRTIDILHYHDPFNILNRGIAYPIDFFHEDVA